MKVVVIEPLGVEQGLLEELAAKHLPENAEVVYYADRAKTDAEMIERGKDADAIIVANQPMSAEVIKGLEKCKYLSVAFTGYDHIAMDACRERGMVVSNCSGYSTAAVADLVFGLLIGLYRRIRECDTAIREGKNKDGLVGFELEGKKFGIIGAGAIGSRVAAIAQAFGCQVYAYSRTEKNLPGVTWVSKEELLSTCDIVSVHVPMNNNTRGLIGEKELSLMKKNAVLINTARGPVVDSAALAKALEAGQIAGAGVDVFENEPPMADHILYHTPHTYLTPHVGFATKEALIKRAIIAFDNISGWNTGKLQNVVS